MSDFERRYVDGEPREHDVPREKHISLEAKDINPSFKIVHHGVEIINQPHIDKVLEHRKKLDESNASKSPKSKAKKLPSKSKQTAVARIQKKL